jgi:hypothetical protein
MYDEEKNKIFYAVDLFTREMVERMYKKYDDGFRGWNDPKFEEIILDKLRNKAELNLLTQKDLIDIANFSMMLYYFQHKRKKDGQ